MKEIWKTIQDFPNYEISSLGNVRNIKKNKMMSIYFRKGYSLVKLSANGHSKEQKVHRLVAQAFIENPCNYDCINHKDEVKSNNSVDNLEWCDHKYNNIYGNRIQRQRKTLKATLQKHKQSKDVDGTFALM